MRYTVHAGNRLASAGIHQATIEGAVDMALSLKSSSGNVRIEDHETGKTYRGAEIEELEKLLRT